MNSIFKWYSENYEKIVTQEITIILSILGVTITIFTVLHSFIINKEIAVKSFEKIIKESKVCPYEYSEMKFGKKHIANSKKLNNHILRIILLSAIVFVIIEFDYLLVKNYYLSFICSLLTILICLYVLSVFFIYIRVYYNKRLMYK